MGKSRKPTWRQLIAQLSSTLELTRDELEKILDELEIRTEYVKKKVREFFYKPDITIKAPGGSETAGPPGGDGEGGHGGKTKKLRKKN